MTYPEILAFARQLRRNQTPAERFFWQKVRNRKLAGKKFRRQYIIEHARFNDISHFFIVDFYCHEHRLIVELDGPVHQQQPEHDQAREEVLLEMGFCILRFKNEQVLENWETVEEELNAYFEENS